MLPLGSSTVISLQQCRSVSFVLFLLFFHTLLHRLALDPLQYNPSIFCLVVLLACTDVHFWSVCCPSSVTHAQAYNATLQYCNYTNMDRYREQCSNLRDIKSYSFTNLIPYHICCSCWFFASGYSYNMLHIVGHLHIFWREYALLLVASLQVKVKCWMLTIFMACHYALSFRDQFDVPFLSICLSVTWYYGYV